MTPSDDKRPKSDHPGSGDTSGRREDARARIELTPAMFHILMALADGERHGYGIMQFVEAATRGEMRLPPGTLYRSIKRLRNDGLIDVSSKRPATEEDDERRRYYRITQAGHEAATLEARRLAEIVGLARARRLLEEHDLV